MDLDIRSVDAEKDRILYIGIKKIKDRPKRNTMAWLQNGSIDIGRYMDSGGNGLWT